MPAREHRLADADENELTQLVPIVPPVADVNRPLPSILPDLEDEDARPWWAGEPVAPPAPPPVRAQATMSRVTPPEPALEPETERTARPVDEEEAWAAEDERTRGERRTRSMMWVAISVTFFALVAVFVALWLFANLVNAPFTR